MAELSSRERVLRALNHQEPDRVPIDFGGTLTSTINQEAYASLVAHLGMGATASAPRIERKTSTIWPSEEVLNFFDVDTRPLLMGAPDNWTDVDYPDGSYMDEWHVVWSRPDGGHYIHTGHPLEDKDPNPAVLENFPWPDPNDPGRVRGLKERARQLHEDTGYAVVLGLRNGPVSLCQWIRGFDNYLCDLVANPAFVEALMGRVVDVWVQVATAALREAGQYVDVVHFQDDIGIQDGPMMSPSVYRRLIKPMHKRMIDAVRAQSDAKVLMHSCGSVYKLIPDLIEIGVDAINPVQVAAADMDSRKLKEEFGDKLAFWGGVDTQDVLPYGTPEQVKEEVGRRIRDLAPGGGYVLNSVHNIQADVPPENIVAMFRAAKELGHPDFYRTGR